MISFLVALLFLGLREAAAAGILRVGKEDTDTNLADLLTKVLSAARRHELCLCVFH